MGRSVTCNYAVHLNLSNGGKLLSSQTCYGAMSFKEVKGIIAAENNYQNEKGKGITVVNAEIWPQTARGEKQIQLDYAIMTPDGKITHHNIS